MEPDCETNSTPAAEACSSASAALGSYTMPFGDRYTQAWLAGMSLKSIASPANVGGLLALAYWHVASKGVFAHREVRAAVGAFLAQPCMVTALESAQLAAQTHRAAVARARNVEAQRVRRQKAEWDDHNLERGIVPRATA